MNHMDFSTVRNLRTDGKIDISGDVRKKDFSVRELHSIPFSTLVKYGLCWTEFADKWPVSCCDTLDTIPVAFYDEVRDYILLNLLDSGCGLKNEPCGPISDVVEWKRSLSGYSFPLQEEPTVVPSWWTSVFFPVCGVCKKNGTPLRSPPPLFDDYEFENVKAESRNNWRKKRNDKRAHEQNTCGRSVNPKARSYFGARRRLGMKPNSADITTIQPKLAASIVEELLLGIWTTTQTKSWSVFFVELYRAVRVACPEFAIAAIFENQVEWFVDYFGDLRDKTWLQISSEVNHGLRSWQSFSVTTLARFFTCILGYIVLGIFNPVGLSKLTKKEFSTLCWRFNNFKHDPTNLITSVWELVDDALSVVRIYKETGCWETALVRDSPYLKLQKDISSIKARHVLFKAGNLHAVESIDEREYLVMLDNARTEVVDIMLTIAPALRRGMEMELKNLNVMYHEVLETTGAQLTKFKPWCVLTLGKSQIGKTVFNQKLVPFACSVMGVPSERKYMYSIPENVNFWDGFRSYKTGLTYDDIANLKSLDMSPVAQTILRLVNNEPLNIEQADIELKGRVWCNAKVLGCTTNIPSLNLDKMIEEHVAILNRFRYHIEMVVKPEYKHETEDKLDVSKMTVAQRSSMFPDVHYYTVYRVRVTSVANDMKLEPTKAPKPFRPDMWHREVVKFDGVEMSNITIKELLPFLIADILKHKEEQQSVLDNAKLLDNKFTCRECMLPLEMCACNTVCECGARAIFGRFTPLCMCEVKLPRVCAQFGESRFMQAGCTLCGVTNTEPCVCGKKNPKTFESSLDRWLERVEECGFKVRSETGECLMCTRVGCTCDHDVGRAFDIAKRDWRKAHLLSYYTYRADCNVTPNSSHCADQFRNNVNAYLHSRMVLLGSEVRCVTESITEESNRFIIEFLEYYYEKIKVWIAFANVAWPLALLDPDKPNYDAVLSNTLWAKRGIKCISKLVDFFSYSTALALGCGYHKALNSFPLATCVLGTMCVNSYRSSTCIHAPLAAGVLGVSYFLCNKSLGRYVMVGSFIMFVEHVVSDFAEDTVVNAIVAAVEQDVPNKVHKLWMAMYQWILNTWNYKKERLSKRFAKGAKRARAKLLQDPAFNVIAEHAPLLVEKVTLARTLRLVVKHLSDFRRGYGIVPNAGFALTLNEALEKAHKYADESYIVAYQRNLEETSDNVQNDHLAEIVKRQTYAMEINGFLYAQCVAVDSNVLMMCAHSFVDGAEVNIVRRIRHDSVKNATFKMRMDQSSILKIEGDMLLYRCSSVGTVKDLSRHFATVKPDKQVYFDIVHREADGHIKEHTGTFLCDHGRVETNGKYQGAYIWSDSFDYSSNFGKKGVSGSPIFTVTSPSRLVGIHIGSFEGGIGTYVHQAAWLPIGGFVTTNIVPLHSMLPLPNSGPLPLVKYDKRVIVHGISEKSILYRLGRGNFRYYGRTTGVSTFNDLDGVVKTPIAPEVTRAFGAKDYTAPKLRGPNGDDNAHKWLVDLNERFNHAQEIPAYVLEWAFSDYVAGLPIPSAKDIVDFQPLSRDEVLNGRVGVNGMESMNFNGSVGEPFNKPLKEYCVQVAAPIGLQYMFTTNMFWDEVDRTVVKYEHGIRAYPIFAMFPKIEPTPVDKDKVRNILNPELSNKMLSRQVLLGPMCYLERYRAASECYVGINPYGEEWDTLYRHFKEKRRCFALDHSKYDLHMSAQLNIAVYAIFWHVMCLLKYDVKYFDILRGLCADTTYPLVFVSGEVIELMSSFTSGSIETSVRNSIANSLLMRCAYYMAFLDLRWFYSPHEPVRFRDMVFLAVYGDDNAGSVHRRCYWFTMRAIQKELARYGYVITDANKSAMMPNYVSIKDVDFLKRSFTYNRELNLYIGTLHPDSILKRLVAILKPKAPNTVREITLQNIDSALDEWALWGESTYNRNRDLLVDCIDKSPGRCMSVTITMSYQQRVERLKAMG